MKSMPCILCAAIIALWALSCADDSTCDDCTDGDQTETDTLDIDSIDFDFTDGDLSGDDIAEQETDTADPEATDEAEAQSCTGNAECTTNEFCNANDICETCTWPELPLKRDNYCATANAVTDQGFESMGAHCVMDTLPPANESTIPCPEGTRCYDIPPEQRSDPNYDGVWAACRTYTEPDWDTGTAGEWSFSGAVPLHKDNTDLSCQTQQDCFDADNTDNVLMFTCTIGQCWGCTKMSVMSDICLDANNLETTEPNAPKARRYQYGLDAYGCPVYRMVTFSCGQGYGCNRDADQAFSGAPASCMPLE